MLDDGSYYFRVRHPLLKGFVVVDPHLSCQLCSYTNEVRIYYWGPAQQVHDPKVQGQLFDLGQDP